eukprot:CAMPEP_0182938858 /NCGR_PEP_ID=MMETSP0105_2-20130417/44622_1 /TAXON_ID=81532 ORGANISM="Acanthoeca-like sp., Strain 10tr" /NCGR_SAMPLE_ID=MMETSP0105_2 /ASSEMBLY_ACC=CAM_ASM_000205 /LENGTH=126 /DNA_ID=CAMNT_0025078207 /DNA_START=43 /DNA_END=420 /DNA_ORIENTATION=-
MTIRVWEPASGEMLAVLKGHTAAVNNVAVHGDVVVSTSDDKAVRMWSLSLRKCTHVFKDAHSNFGFGVALHRHTVVSGGFDNTVKVWSLTRRQFLYYLDADLVIKLAIDVDGDRLVVARGPANDAA